jgi:uncharacterized protein (DUF58 family)
VSTPLLDPRVVTQLGRHQLTPRQRVLGRYQGAHRSARLGASVDFADVREYVPGDDPRRIDLSASRRHGRLQVTLTEAEDDASAQLVLDASASMAGTKWSAACGLTAGLTVLGARDGVRLWTVGRSADGDRVGGRMARGNAALAITAALLTEAEPSDGHGEGAPGPPAGRPDLASAVRRAARSATRGPLVLVSDLLFEGWDEVVLALGGGRRDALVLQLLARDELAPDLVDDVRLVDRETGEEVEVGPHDRVLAGYDAALRDHLDAVASSCAKVGAGHLVVADDADLADVLLRELAGLGFVR